jgi:hypothetical protein
MSLAVRAPLAERIGAVEVVPAQHADLPRVEAVEAAHGADVVLGRRHRPSVGELVD